MGNALLDYLNKRMRHQESQLLNHRKPGPLITISRQAGCEGVRLASMLADRLNKPGIEPEWKVLSKEIFYRSAKELNINPQQVMRIFKSDSNFINEILTAFGTKNFKSEKMIIRTVNDVVHSFAEEGYCIIVGRAAHIIAQDIKNALHIRLNAPFEYRLKKIMDNKGLSLPAATDFIDLVEKERSYFRKAFNNESQESGYFDLCINRSTFDEKEIIDIIQLALKKKNILSDFNQPVQYY